MTRYPKGRGMWLALCVIALLFLLPHRTQAWVDGPCMMAEEYQWAHRGWNWLCVEYLLSVEGDGGDNVEGFWW